jgi:hypothetical protein
VEPKQGDIVESYPNTDTHFSDVSQRREAKGELFSRRV